MIPESHVSKSRIEAALVEKYPEGFDSYYAIYFVTQAPLAASRKTQGSI